MCEQNHSNSAPLFALGQVVATPGALEALNLADIDILSLLHRHQHGDWGNVSADDAAENNRSVVNDWRILSSYAINNTQNVWIITEADRSATTLLLPEEY